MAGHAFAACALPLPIFWACCRQANRERRSFRIIPISKALTSMRSWPLLPVRRTILSSRRNRLCSFSSMQLPPSLAEALRNVACQAVHVVDLGLLTATDQQIWDEAISRSAVLITKDRDFPLFRAATNAGPAILSVRVGNTDNRTLIAQMLRSLPAIIDAVERGETVIEFIGR